MHHVEVDVARSGQVIGRFTLLQLRKSVETGSIRPDDHYYDTRTQNWVELVEHPFLRGEFQRVAREARSKKFKTYLASATSIVAAIAVVVVSMKVLPSLQNDADGPPSGHEQTAKLTTQQAAIQTQGGMTSSERSLEAEAFGRYGNEIFPSFILTMANLNRKQKGGTELKYGDEAQAAVVVKNVKKGDRYQVEISADRFINKVTKQFVFSQDSAAEMMAPLTTFDFLELTKVKQTMPFNVTFRITRHDGKVFEDTQVWQVRQINDCPLRLDQRGPDKAGKVVSTRIDWPKCTFAGYVNENHPWINSILAEALRTGLVDSFNGPGDWADNASVEKQLAAIWQALKVRGITYSNIASHKGSSTSQHVRFFEECIETTQANCIDGTAMLASIYRKIGFSVGIALVPGHAYLVIYDNEGHHIGVETTMVGTHSFNAAMQHASEIHEFSTQKLEKMNKEQIAKLEVALINIDECRKEGVEPIPFMGKDGALSTTAPLTFSRPRTLVNEDDVTSETEKYLNSNGVLSARQYGSRIELMSRQLLEKQSNIDRAAQLKRKAAAYRLVEEMENAIVAFSGAGSPGERVDKAIVECLKEAEKHRRSFVALNPEPTLFPTENRVTDAELSQIYEDCKKTLRSLSLRPEAQQDANSLAEAVTLCKALKDISELPLKFN